MHHFIAATFLHKVRYEFCSISSCKRTANRSSGDFSLELISLGRAASIANLVLAQKIAFDSLEQSLLPLASLGIKDKDDGHAIPSEIKQVVWTTEWNTQYGTPS